MKKETSLLEYLRALPEGSTLDIVDESTHEPLDYYCGASARFLGEGKDVTIYISKQYEPTGIYDIKLLSGISCLAERWKQLREDYYHFACHCSDDDRWQDEGFRSHMYNQYVNTDRPITDQLYNLDDLNLKTLFRFIKEDLCGGDAERVRAI